MLSTYIKRLSTQAIYYSGPVGPYLDKFTNWLEQLGCKHETIRHRLLGAAQFGFWAQKTGHSLQSPSAARLSDYSDYLSKRGHPSFFGLHFSLALVPDGTHCGISRCHWIAIEIGIVIGCHFISITIAIPISISMARRRKV